jgi:flagellar motor switch protein FliN/FliY
MSEQQTPETGATVALREEPAAPAPSNNLDIILRIPVSVQVVLGCANMPVAELMKLQRGSVIGLDHHVGEPIEVMVNGRTIARGEVVLMDDDQTRFGVSLTEIVSDPLSGKL